MFGSILYDIGGFSLPFLIVGTVALIVTISILIVVPNVKKNVDDSLRHNSGSLDIRGALEVPRVFKTIIQIDIKL